MRRSLFVVSLAVIIALSGCKASTKPKTLMRLSADDKPRLRAAPLNGEYRLYAATRPSKRSEFAPSGEPLATQRLRRKDPLGFRRTSGGELSAVAGEQTIALQRGSAYVWQMRPDADQIDRTKTTMLVVGIIAVGVFTGIAIASSSVSFGNVGFGL
jgi:hypothetical protein